MSIYLQDDDENEGIEVFCPYCGKQLDVSAKFCLNCGAQQP